MKLTAQERETIERSDMVPFVLPGSSVEFVIGRRDLLDPRFHPQTGGTLGETVESPPLIAEMLDDEQAPPRRRIPTSIIGVWKMDPPPTDAEVERILEDELVRKYG